MSPTVLTASRWIAALSIVGGMSAYAAELQNDDDGSVVHVASGWTFPSSIESFKREAEASSVPGTGHDAVAKYTHAVEGGAQINASVYIYPSRTQALDASIIGAKQAIESVLPSGVSDFLCSRRFAFSSRV
jgi:hypothetical protein